VVTTGREINGIKILSDEQLELREQKRRRAWKKSSLYPWRRRFPDEYESERLGHSLDDVIADSEAGNPPIRRSR
jgi:hypothetical protein